ncbi:hypothetical protein Cgig2_002424 [Carnegiea gigantea]|uniref:UDP-glucose 4-epimerase n=1 Tax=Carnegiea gigantea TaxID=171969 RepID=A0A9Q1QP10_9CARY|nr:hypothetical protein Cgig2_002424 [Carnegiea gigantea]
MGSEERNILVTGGAGFVGTHCVLQLLKEGFRVVIIDNLDNSCEEAVHRVKELAGPQLASKLEFHLGDLRNKDDLEKLFSNDKFDAVIHFAGLKAVGESVAQPLRYFDNNLIGSINLYQTMAKYDCKKLVFSSSATVYGQPEKIPCVEDFDLKAMNPYGRTKLFLEEIARDIWNADKEWRIILLRYFNPVGAHESGRLGEDPKGIPNNLMPYIQQVAVGRLPELNVYGTDYPTKDRTAIRDYIHVMDLADGHVAALRKLFTTDIGCTAINLGTGRGASVLEMVAAFEKASGKAIVIINFRKSRLKCAQGDQEMLQLFMPQRRRLKKNSAGRPNTALMRCAGINGSGQATIHGVIKARPSDFSSAAVRGKSIEAIRDLCCRRRSPKMHFERTISMSDVRQGNQKICFTS